MKLVRFDGSAGARAGVVVGDAVVDLEPLGFLDLLSVVREGVGALVRTTAFASSAPSVPLASARLLAPIDRPGKYLAIRSEEHPTELQSLMRISYAVFYLQNNNNITYNTSHYSTIETTI